MNHSLESLGQSPSTRHIVRSAVATYMVTTAIVLGGVWFGDAVLERQLYPDEPGIIKSMSNWDGRYYVEITSGGYVYKTDKMSSVAFYPAYPTLSSFVKSLTGLSATLALLVVSHSCLIGIFILLGLYVRKRFPDRHQDLSDNVLLAMAFWPTTMFFRMTYSESQFVLVLLWAMFGMACGWRFISIAFIVGLATACRPTGLAIVPPFLIYLWERTTTRTSFLAHAILLFPICCWGLLAFMTFQYIQFGEPLAFTKVIGNWPGRTHDSIVDYAMDLLTFEPLVAVYHSNSPSYWRNFLPRAVIFNPQFANPIYYVVTTVLAIVGIRNRWLNYREFLLCAFLLLIPYLTIGHKNAMAGFGRYASVAFPIYIVLGHLSSRIPRPIPTLVYALLGFLLGAYSALFAVWYFFI